MFTIKQAAAKAGITEGLLILWISTEKFRPSVELSTASHKLTGVAKKAFEAFAPDGELFGWSRFQLTAQDVKRLGSMVEQTAIRKLKAEPAHVKGSAYIVNELATLWGFSPDKIRELFHDEPDVIKVKSPAKKGKRAYTSLRIPESVAARVHRRMS